MIRLFKKSLEKRPLLTQVVATGIICGAGDGLAQIALEKRSLKNYDIPRTGRFFFIGSFIITPAASRWYQVLEKYVQGNPKVVPFKRMLADQFVFSPFFNGVVLVILRMMEGIGFKESYRRMEEDWSDIYFNSLKIWPAVQLVNFYLMPLNMRVIVVQLVAFFWNSYVSFRTQRSVDADSG